MDNLPLRRSPSMFQAMKTAPTVKMMMRETVFDGFSRMHRLRFRHRRHDGGWTQPKEREIFERGDAAALLPYDPRLDRVVLIEQFRIGGWLSGRDSFQLEPVAGIIENGDPALDVAIRESREEAGLEILAVEPMPSYLVSPGCATETVHSWCGWVDSRGVGGIHGSIEEEEDIRVHVLDFAEVVRRYEQGAFGYALTLLAVQWLMLNRDRLRKLWVQPSP